MRAPVVVFTILVLSVTEASFPWVLVQTPRATLPFSERVLRKRKPTIDQWPIPSLGRGLARFAASLAKASRP